MTLALEDVDQLFAPRGADLWDGKPELPAGIDQLRNELASRPRRGPATAVIVLPRAKIRPDLERAARQALDVYCSIGLTRVENELKAIRREGVRALVLGAVLLAIFLGLSEAVLHSDFPASIRIFFGDGLFVVAAWVGMWYPLEMLIYTGRPHRVEQHVLRVIREMEIVVRAAD